MVLPEDGDLGVRVSEAVAVEEQTEFGDEGDANSDDGRVVKAFCCGFGALSEFLGGEGDQEDGDGGHEEAEAYVAGGFYPCFAGWVFAGIDAGDGAVADDEHDVGTWVED